MAADQLRYGPAPAWATPKPLIIPAKAADASSTEILLFDNQSRLDPTAMTSVVHYAVRLNDAQALAAGNVAIGWDPAFDEATVNSVRIVRGGESIDPLAKGQKFTILRRETGLEQQTLDGRLTANLQTEGLQVGDIVEVTQTIVHRDPTLKGHVEAVAAFPYPVRMNQARFRMLAPASVTLRDRETGGLPPVRPRTIGGDRIYEWDLAPLEPGKPPEGAPDRFATGIGFELTDYGSWNDLAATMLPLFQQAAQIPAGSPLNAEVARIRALSPDPAVRAAAALALVESKVRYVNLALGTGGLVPASADVTWQRRFGDCKAKSVLLTALLRALDIDATPVLVSTARGDGLDRRLPMFAAFNHVIVRSVIGGKTYWLDGTRIGDQSLAPLTPPDYRWALPVAANAALVPIVETPAALPLTETIIHTDASGGADKPVPTVLDMITRGDSALVTNLAIEQVDPSRREEALKDALQGRLDRFVVTKASSRFDPVTQTLTIHGEGSQTLNIDNGTYWSEVPSPGYKADFRRTGNRDLDAPVAIAFPAYSHIVQTVVLPKSLADGFRMNPADIDQTIAGVAYKRRVTNRNGVVTIDYTSRSLVPEISIADARAAEAGLRKLDNDNVWLRLGGASAPTAAEIKALIGKTPVTVADKLAAAAKLSNQGDNEKAIALLNEAIKQDPTNLNAYQMRAMMSSWVGEFDQALADSDHYLKRKPGEENLITMRAGIFVRRGDMAKALAEAHSLDNAKTAKLQLLRGNMLRQLGHADEALAAYGSALAIEPSATGHAMRAAALPLTDKAGRARELDAALKLELKDVQTMVMLADIAARLGEHAKSVELYDRAFLKSPDDLNLRSNRAVELERAGRKADAVQEYDAIEAKAATSIDLNNLCWAMAIADVEIDRALKVCNKSLDKSAMRATSDSRGLVMLRLKRTDDAIADYTAALAGGDSPSSLYGRAIAYARKGDKAKSDADAAAALKLDPTIDRTYAGYGLSR
ncbi:DUF3857 domain-containing protein [Sphingomonas sp. ASV193]|uniref:DUF3857 domain-containing protein n=1 Tax=Sphingomonas sp. ASV193 TaxID=3144405 RepID=UPI0032E92A2B